MLKVDLARLDKRRRVRIDVDLAPDDPLWGDADPALARPVKVRLAAERPGSDVIVRGRIEGEIEAPCRRCLNPVRVRFGDEVTLLYRSGIDPFEAELEEAYSLAGRARELDLSGAVREHVLLAVPGFVLCREDCRGLCPICGIDRNVAECACEVAHGDERWAALRRLRLD